MIFSHNYRHIYKAEEQNSKNKKKDLSTSISLFSCATIKIETSSIQLFHEQPTSFVKENGLKL